MFKVEDVLGDFIEKNIAPDTIVIDPPRDGMFKGAPENILRFRAREIVYVSCNPSTLARDLETLVGSGEYAILDVTPVDNVSAYTSYRDGGETGEEIENLPILSRKYDTILVAVTSWFDGKEKGNHENRS